jgi:hypothetical protein
MMSRRAARMAAWGLAVTLLLPACARKSEGIGPLRDAMARTEALARQFHYSEHTARQTVLIDGQVEDDLRYQADTSLDGHPAVSEVVSDDNDALRVVDYARVIAYYQANVPGFTVPPVVPAGVAPTASPSPAPASSARSTQLYPSAATLAALQAGSWVLDKRGALDLVIKRRSGSDLGQDPVLDALTVLTYVDRSIDQARDVAIFNPDALDYRPAEDPFPQPDRRHGEIRYDLIPPDLPPRDATVNSEQQRIQNLPQLPYFRKLSVYVRSGVVESVREAVSVKARLQQANNDVLQRLDEVGVHIASNLSVDRQADAVAIGLERFRKQTLGDPIRVREMSLDLGALDGGEKVQLPDGSVDGSLGSSLVRGQVLQQRGL